MLGRIRGALAAALLAVFLAAPAGAIFDQIYEFDGVIGNLGRNYFIVVNPSNSLVRVKLREDQTLPQDIMVGVRVKVILEQEEGEWVLRELKRLDPIPGAPSPE